MRKREEKMSANEKIELRQDIKELRQRVIDLLSNNSLINLVDVLDENTVYLDHYVTIKFCNERVAIDDGKCVTIFNVEQLDFETTAMENVICRQILASYYCRFHDVNLLENEQRNRPKTSNLKLQQLTKCIINASESNYDEQANNLIIDLMNILD